MIMEVQETFFLSALNPALGYGNGQFTVFASDLGWPAGEVPTDIDLHSPKSDRTITFKLVKTTGDHFYYKPTMKTPARFAHLSILVFND
jgi:hypothetical protein